MSSILHQQNLETILAGLTVEQKIGQVLHPFVRPQDSPEAIQRQFGNVQPGGVFVMPGTRQEMVACIDAIQQNATVPVVISSDLENGPGRMIKDSTVFPDLMALAAASKIELARSMAQSAAMEGREVGIHWTFGPVMDINSNPQNPITNTRSLGDNPDLIIELGNELICEMQRNGLAATAKHFPGDGFDSRDQHVCTSINPLSQEDWFRLSGRVFRAAIEAGVWTIMIGHISLPSFDPGTGESLGSAPPATLSRRLTTELLRERLGFQGLIVSDASHMGGLTSRDRREGIVPGMLGAGCDQVLFCDTEGDFRILLSALKSGVLSTARLDDAVRRVLALKQQLGLFEDVHGAPVTPGERNAFAAASRTVAESAVTLVRDRLGALPCKLGSGRRVLSLHLRGDAAYNVDGIDDLLRGTGADVVRRTEAEGFNLAGPHELEGYDAILLHWVYGPSWNTNRIRPNGNYLRDVVLSIPIHDTRVVHISYGTPYLLHDLPEIPALINAYSPDAESQRAVVSILQGKLIPKGISPVRLALERDWFPFNRV